MKKRDFILIGAILAVVLVMFAVMTLTKKEGAYVVVTVDGAEVAKYSLSEDGEHELNGGTNVLKIENGEAWMIEADCPTLGSTRCTAQGKISKTREVIYCQPNNVLVTVYGTEENSDIELIS
jgi:hypothetical protein